MLQTHSRKEDMLGQHTWQLSILLQRICLCTIVRPLPEGHNAVVASVTV